MPYSDPQRQREAQARWAAKRQAADPESNRAIRRAVKLDRIARLDDYKRDKPCADCGGMFHPVAMDFDHEPGTKFYGISQMVRGRWRWERILEEIAKCELVCANCHRVRTHLRLA